MVNVKYQLGVWRTLLDLLQSQKYWMNELFADFGITPLMAHAVRELPLNSSMTMKELAATLWCDASNTTGIVDRLESRGFAERSPAEHDRRVKCVALTAAGKRLRRKVNERFNQSPPAIAALSDTDQQTLLAILERAVNHAAKQREQSAV